MAEARLPEEEREAIERHLASCPDCLRVAGAILRETAPAATPALPRRRLLPALLAASVLLAAGILGARSFLRTPIGSTEESLLSSAGDLARERPDLFGGFHPLSREERLAPGRGVLRAGFSVLHPSGRVLEVRPSFRWEPERGVREWKVGLFLADGTPLWTAASGAAFLDYPAAERELQRGRGYLWEVSGEGPLGRVASTRVFSVATDGEREAFATGLREIEGRVSARVRDLVLAHFALSGGFHAEAEKAARGFVASHPDDPVGRETLFHVLGILGSSEASRFAPKGR